jgi:hypothetical protein
VRQARGPGARQAARAEGRQRATRAEKGGEHGQGEQVRRRLKVEDRRKKEKKRIFTEMPFYGFFLQVLSGPRRFEPVFMFMVPFIRVLGIKNLRTLLEMLLQGDQWTMDLYLGNQLLLNKDV